MTNVISLPPRDQDKVVWRCNCGCMSFLMRADGDLECCQCEKVVTSAVGEWRSKLPPTPDDAPELSDGDIKITDLNHSGAALRRALGRADEDATAALIVIQQDGAVTTWGQDGDRRSGRLASSPDRGRLVDAGGDPRWR